MKEHADMKNYMIANAKTKIKDKRLWSVLILVNIFGMPYFILTKGYEERNIGASFVICGLAMVINMILGIIIPLKQFDYLFTKIKTDMAYALPMTRRQQFLSDFFSGLALYAGIYMGQVILSILFMICDLDTWNESINGTMLFTTMVRALMLVLLIQISLYTLTTLVIACTGAKIEAILASLYINLLIPGAIYIVGLLINRMMFGVDISKKIMDLIESTSPFGGFLALLEYIFSWEQIGGRVIALIVVTALFFVGAYLIITRRHAEDVGKPYVIRMFYHIVTFTVMVLIGIISVYYFNSIILYVVFTFIFYFIIELITNRGLNHLLKSLCRYVGMTVSAVVLMLTVIHTNFFGLTSVVANPAKVNFIELSYPGISGNMYNYSTVRITDKEMIECILEVQEDEISAYENQRKNLGINSLLLEDDRSYYFNGKPTMDITVHKKNGRTYTRTYELSYASVLKMAKVELSKEYIDGMTENYMREVNNKNIRRLAVQDIFGIQEKQLYYDEQGKNNQIVIEFFEAWQKDMKNIPSVEEYLRPTKPSQYVVNMGGYDFIIRADFTNCIAFLNQYNACMTVEHTDLERLVHNHEISLAKGNSSWENQGGWENSSFGGSYPSEEYYMEKLDEKLEQLISVAEAFYASEEECYQLYINGRKFIIPIQYSDLANTIYRQY